MTDDEMRASYIGAIVTVDAQDGRSSGFCRAMAEAAEETWDQWIAEHDARVRAEACRSEARPDLSPA